MRTPPAIPEPKILNPDMLSAMTARLTGYYELLAEWIRDNALELLIAIVIGFALYVVLSWIKRKAATNAARRGDDGQIATVAWRALSRTKRFFRIILAVELVNSVANTPAPLSRAIFIVFTVAAVIQLAIWLREIILALIERRAYQSGTEHDTLQSAMTLIKLGVSFAFLRLQRL
jgi:hypothetical protein